MPCKAVRNQIAVQTPPVGQEHFTQRAPIRIAPGRSDRDNLPERLFSSELSCPRAEGLIPLGRIDPNKANSLRPAMVQHFDRVSIDNTDHLRPKLRPLRWKRNGYNRNG